MTPKRPSTFVSNNIIQRKSKESGRVSGSALTSIDEWDMSELEYHVTVSNIDKSGRDKSRWIMDSGCSQTSTFDRSLLNNFKQRNGSIIIGDGSRIEILGSGTMDLKTIIGGKIMSLSIDGVYYIPQLTRNLLSYGQLTTMGLYSDDRSTPGVWKFFDRYGQMCLQLKRSQNNMYETTTTDINDELHTSLTLLEHRRMGHLGQLVGNDCDTCNITKMTKPSPCHDYATIGYFAYLKLSSNASIII
ncbi:hypothetical protein SeLEV6574_g08648 [Synchytrium endobioticum]|uniref:Retrovirus-related Pol polyprotein from transposon TNT 1-94-like beta-barrel domain-containing protein n=1 Tax=Synchytrium endobioticum TaxID=286115 RepID=A0A507BR08_9FUNG|nr:hypothetical protein SeLEV6574_g08648 [Synchytrium endobioticum]